MTPWSASSLFAMRGGQQSLLPLSAIGGLPFFVPATPSSPAAADSVPKFRNVRETTTMVAHRTGKITRKGIERLTSLLISLKCMGPTRRLTPLLYSLLNQTIFLAVGEVLPAGMYHFHFLECAPLTCCKRVRKMEQTFVKRRATLAWCV